jgi:hypothetical protein
MKKEWMYFIAGAGLAVAIMSATILIQGDNYSDFDECLIKEAPSLDTACDTVMSENLNNLSITDADMQAIIDDLTVDMDSTLDSLSLGLSTNYLKTPHLKI